MERVALGIWCRCRNQIDADYQLYASNVLEEITLNLPRTPELDNAGKNILRRFNLLEFQDRHPVPLSGGQKQRVLLRERPLLLLDEPTSVLRMIWNLANS